MSAAKGAIMQRQKALLEERYDLRDRPAAGVTMSRGKAIQAGVRVKLRGGMTWESLAQLNPEAVRDKDVWPLGFMPLPHPNHPEGGMLFPKYLIDEIKKQEGRELARFDLDFDLPDHFMPEFPPAIFLTTRPDLGDVSQGKLVTIGNSRDYACW
jgi:cytochrome c peroxidase